MAAPADHKGDEAEPVVIGFDPIRQALHMTERDQQDAVRTIYALQKQLQQAQVTIDKLERDNEILRAGYNKLANMIKQKEAEIVRVHKTLTNEIIEKKRAYDALRRKYNHSANTYNELSHDHKLLTEKYAALQAEMRVQLKARDQRIQMLEQELENYRQWTNSRPDFDPTENTVEVSKAVLEPQFAKESSRSMVEAVRSRYTRK